MGKVTKDKNGSFLFLAGMVVILWAGLAIIIHFGPVEGTLQERGAFGDSFGAINALFAGLAFVGVVYAILLQREELRLQREELKLTRQELSRSASAQEASSQIQAVSATSQADLARLTALTSLLNWEMENEQRGLRYPTLGDPKLGNPEKFGFGRANDSAEDIARQIKEILNRQK